MTFVLSADAGICLASTLDADPMAGLCGVLMLLVPGLYVTFFHGPALVVAHVAICLVAVVVVLTPVALGPDADPALTVAKGATAVMVLVVIPTMTHIGLWLLRADAAASLVDPLTGLLNRRGFTTQMSRLMVASQGTVSDHLAVVVYDLDNFKRVNDTYGHDAGDLVLRRATQCVDQQLPLSAIHARLGGEEFAVAAARPPTEVRALAEAVRLAVQMSDGHTPVTASVGVTSTPISGIDSTDLEVRVIEWLRDADRAMYRSKRSGGNAVGVDG
ncbi:GGDEF domain-containing protein [Williamsia maris]|uniref:GGDEF domain-containing protein n=1 Tax=Williamsia maris TaxID=72806 RepID=UPI0020A3D225|nr:GGDEF domain-containing protein [Williamsia maris]